MMPIRIPCEGTDQPAFGGSKMNAGTCSICGVLVTCRDDGTTWPHDRNDVAAMLDHNKDEATELLRAVMASPVNHTGSRSSPWKGPGVPRHVIPYTAVRIPDELRGRIRRYLARDKESRPNMRTIHKFPFAVRDQIEIEAPVGARVVHVENQGGEPCLWMEVQTDHAMGRHFFTIRGTGHEIPDNVQHVATWKDGPFVWHMFK